MKKIKLLLNITIIFFMIFAMIFMVIAEKKISILQKDLKNLRTELGKQRIISHRDYFYSPIDTREMKTIQNEILWRLKLEYVKTPAQKKLIKRRWR